MVKRGIKIYKNHYKNKKRYSKYVYHHTHYKPNNLIKKRPINNDNWYIHYKLGYAKYFDDWFDKKYPNTSNNIGFDYVSKNPKIVSLDKKRDDLCIKHNNYLDEARKRWH